MFFNISEYYDNPVLNNNPVITISGNNKAGMCANLSEYSALYDVGGKIENVVFYLEPRKTLTINLELEYVDFIVGFYIGIITNNEIYMNNCYGVGPATISYTNETDSPIPINGIGFLEGNGGIDFSVTITIKSILIQ